MTATPVTHLDDARSWAFLAAQRVGRLVTHVAGEPEIFPVNFAVSDGRIVLRSGEGTKLFALTVNQRVVFEADTWDDEGGTSVVARATARELSTSEEIAWAESLPLRTWVPTTKTHWIVLDVHALSGRAFRFGPEPEPEPPVGDD